MSNLDILKVALRKLRHYYYYEKNDLITRTEVLTFEEDSLLFVAQMIEEPSKAKMFLDKISINIYPKTIIPKNEEIKPSKNKNVFSNEHLASGGKIQEFLKMAYMPVELHLISVVWLMAYGKILDNELSTNALGNRLDDIGQGLENINPNRKIFKNYLSQYNLWWRNAITSCKDQLDGKRDVTMINFDIKSFYNNVDFDFEEIETFINSKVGGYKTIENDPIHKILKQIHSKYRSVYYDAQGKSKERKKLTILPIGLLTSFVLANWYLKDIDKKILDLDPIFYGRYVDDFIIVFQGKSFSDFNNADDVIKHKLERIISINSKENEYEFLDRQSLKLKGEKTFIYKFSHKYPPSLLDKFIDDQKSRSSEFRFLSDEEDENFEDFDKVTFEQNFNLDEGNKARFKVIEENKFKMSAYFAKLISRRISNGEGYKEDEIDKIYQFFKGYYLLKNYQFWEKIFAVFIIYEKYEHLNKLINEVRNEIETSVLDDCIDVKNIDYKICLYEYLDCVIKQVLVLKPKNIVKKFDYDFDPKYLTSLRSHYTFFPWLQYTKVAKMGNLDLTDRNIYQSHSWESGDLEINGKIIPYRVKYYYAVMQEFYKKMFTP